MHAVQYVIYVHSVPISARCGLNWEENPNSNNCYQFFDKQLDWSDAREICQSNGGDLASIESQQEQYYVSGEGLKHWGDNPREGPVIHQILIDCLTNFIEEKFFDQNSNGTDELVQEIYM